jgi:hypothetical protein
VTELSFSEALREAERWVDHISGVERVAEGLNEGEPCITVFVCAGNAAASLPRSIGPWRVVIDGIGRPPPG